MQPVLTSVGFRLRSRHDIRREVLKQTVRGTYRELAMPYPRRMRAYAYGVPAGCPHAGYKTVLKGDRRSIYEQASWYPFLRGLRRS